MRDRISIRKTGAKWTVKVPTIGFGPGEAKTVPTHKKAVDYADARIRRYSSTTVTSETVWQSTDGVAPHPGWNSTVPVEREI